MQIYFIEPHKVKQNKNYFGESIKINLNFLKLISHLTFYAIQTLLPCHNSPTNR